MFLPKSSVFAFSIMIVSCAETKFDSAQKSTTETPEVETQEQSFDQTPHSNAPKPQNTEQAKSGIVADRTGMIELTFIDETAGFLNTLGWYRVNANGAMLDPEIIWTNASHSTSHRSIKEKPTADGPIQPGDQATVGPIKEGESVRFFLVADGYDQNNWDQQDKPNYINRTSGSFEFRTSSKYSDGELAFVTSDGPFLFYIPEKGEPILIKSRSGVANNNAENSIFHAAYDAEDSLSLNPDGHNHIRHEVIEKNKKWKIGVEDLYYFDEKGKNEYDGDFADLIFSVELLSSDEQ
ncbi:MAG: hypothetical protein AB8C84_09960 [Oligoflexales bacterium]